jgi:membrane-bound metal-dependent hydrolase YbcI (DUF457 family)
MVDVIGHLGMALIWLAPAWFFLDEGKTAVTFVGVGFWFGVLPDVDLYLQRVFEGFKHHGVLHTILAVSLIALFIGPLVGWLLERTIGGSDWFSSEAEDRAASFGFLMVEVAGLSHIFADVLSAPDIAEAIEPFWPLYQHSIGIDLVWYNSPAFNWALFVVGLALNVGLYYWKLESNRSAGPESQ